MPRRAIPHPTANRTDLVTPGPVRGAPTAPDQEYGKATAQAQSMKMQPIGTPAQPAAAGPSAPAPAPATPQIPSFTPAQPGARGWIDQPGSGGPPTTGLPNSSGPGPEALTGLGAQVAARNATEQGTLRDLLTHLSSQPMASSMIRTLASAAGR